MSKRIIVYFDGACPLCRREIAFMRRLDWLKRLDFIDVAGSDAVEACPIDQAELLERFHVRDRDGALKSGAAAFAAMWRSLPLMSPFGHLARIPPVLWLFERIYRGFLRIRPRIQRAAARLEPGTHA